MNNIKKAREDAGLSQKEIALTLDVSSPTVSEWESGKKNPNNDNLRSLADILHRSIDYLLGRSDDPTPPKEKPATQNEQPVTPEIAGLMEDVRDLTQDEAEIIRHQIAFVKSRRTPESQ